MFENKSLIDSRLVYILLPSLLISIQLLSGAKKISEHIVSYLCIGQFWWDTYLILGVFMFSSVSFYLTTRRRFKRLEKIDNYSEGLMDDVIGNMIKRYKNQKDVDLKINIMEPRKGLYKKVPKGVLEYPEYFEIFPTHLEMTWLSKNMMYDPDSNLRMTSNQGSAGRCYRRGTPVVVNLTERQPSEFSVRSTQMTKTEGLKFILSFPIFKKPSGDRANHEVIGVLNIHSRSDGAESLIEDEQQRDSLIERAKRFSEYSSKLL